MDRAAGAIRGRAARVAHIVSGEMDNYETGAYTEGVMRNVQYLTNSGMCTFLGFNLHRAFCRGNPNIVTGFQEVKVGMSQ